MKFIFLCEKSEIWFVKPEKLVSAGKKGENNIVIAYEALNILTELNYLFYEDPQIDEKGNVKKNINLNLQNVKED